MFFCLCAAVPVFGSVPVPLPVPEPVSLAANRVCTGVYDSMSVSTFASVSASLSDPVPVCAEAGILTVCAVHSGLYMPYAQ